MRPLAALLVLSLLTAGCRGGDRRTDRVLAVTLTPAPGDEGTAPPMPPATAASSAVPPGSPGPRIATPNAGPPVDPARIAVSIERVAAGFTQPVLITHAGDGSGRLFIVEKPGRIRLADGATFLDLSDRVLSPPLFSYEREQGLLGLAFHPRFASTGFFYVHYNDKRGEHIISRFRVRPDGLGDPTSEKLLLTQSQPETNFNGGMLAFGPDGFLYIGLGTGGTAVALQQDAQNLGSLLGKILRIDVDRGDPYAIPQTNPFAGRGGARPEVWAYGLRNPWRFSFDRATGDLYIGGPGEFKRKWINFHAAATPPGQNFGWPLLEGTLCWQQATCVPQGIQLPIIEYNTYEDGNCVVIGGYVYRGQAHPSLRGAYLYGDFCSGRIWAAARNAAGAWVTAEAARVTALISSFGEDEAGELYVADINGGVIYRLTAKAR